MGHWGMRRLAHGAAILAIVVAAMVSGAVAAAQDAPNGVLVVNMDRLLNDSLPARDIKAQADDLRAQLRAEHEEAQAVLRAEETELAELRETLDAEAFRARAAAFEERVRGWKRATNVDSARLQRGLFDATEELKAALGPILGDLMAETQAAVMLDAREALLFANQVDVTDEAIKRLDAQALEIKVRLPDLARE